MSTETPWASLLFVPANVERFVRSAPERGASGIILDLEDSVAPEAKGEARTQAREAIEFLQSQSTDCLVRVNAELGLCVDDLRALVGPGLKAICLPKVRGPDHLQLIDEFLAELESERGMPVGTVRILAMIETLDALLNVDQIARACPRLLGLGFGSEDLSLAAGFEPTPENLLDPCTRILYACRRAGIRAFGFPGSIANFRDLDAYAAQVGRGKSMGFDGVLCIHPAQVAVVEEIYAADPAAIAHARRVVAAFEKAGEGDSAVVSVDGQMVDLPVVERCRRLLAAASE